MPSDLCEIDGPALSPTSGRQGQGGNPSRVWGVQGLTWEVPRSTARRRGDAALHTESSEGRLGCLGLPGGGSAGRPWRGQLRGSQGLGSNVPESRRKVGLG
jgi:hypothetical protein